MRHPLRLPYALAVVLLTAPHVHGHPTPPKHFQGCASMTGRTATIILARDLPPTLDGRPIEPGDEIAVFTPSGTCAGVAVWRGTSLAIAVWEDDSGTSAEDGVPVGAAFTLRAWRAATGEEFRTTAISLSRGRGTAFVPDAIYEVSGLAFATGTGTEPTETLAFELAPAYPNPFHARTTLAYTLPSDEEVRLEVFDLLGRRVAVVVDEAQRAGRHEVAFAPDADLAAGVYVGRLRAGTHTALARFTLLR